MTLYRKRKTSMMRRNKKMGEQNRNYGQIKEITLHFGNGALEPFTAKDGREMLKIVIPNADRSDHTPWASFVLPAKAVHESQYCKGLWTKIPADGQFDPAGSICCPIHLKQAERPSHIDKQGNAE